MPYECAFTGKKTKFGKKRAWHGQAITKGGFGLKPTGITRRTFRPNLQEVTAVIDGAPTRVKASTRAIRSGMVIKPLKRKYGYTRKQKEAAAAR
ncbi:MAG: 50S ribosomal protein L28 [Phycisphaerales bacterium]